jgi:hypothetical protein
MMWIGSESYLTPPRAVSPLISFGKVAAERFDTSTFDVRFVGNS